ncbi:hypothetical protein CVT24_012686 [Panaeolus cyanescens]|uniref:Uncharacterized protein n=1 Tax=Panaeolus cyanescens TaxID=181874 RepID=A0A409YK62_9AGAR|nr:hypothetical protein CVT24_012686 [Panaeolus cyanescens]
MPSPPRIYTTVQPLNRTVDIPKTNGSGNKPHTVYFDQQTRHTLLFCADPCGWCAGSGCKTQLVLKDNGSCKILSNCSFHYEGMVYSKAATYSENTPCTNVPVPCSICLQKDQNRMQLPTFWKYNLVYHMLVNHLSPSKTLPPFPPDLVVSCHISQREEQKIGIPQTKTQEFRQLSGAPPSDDIQALEESLKRERSGSTSASKQPVKKKKGGKK